MLSRGARHFALFRGAVRGHGWGPTQGEGFLCMPVALVSPPSATCLYVCTHGRHAFVWFALVNRDRVWLSACCNDYSVLTQFWMSLFYCRGRSCIRALPRGHDFLRTPALAPSAGGSRCQRRPPDPHSCPPPPPPDVAPFMLRSAIPDMSVGIAMLSCMHRSGMSDARMV